MFSHKGNVNTERKMSLRERRRMKKEMEANPQLGKSGGAGHALKMGLGLAGAVGVGLIGGAFFTKQHLHQTGTNVPVSSNIRPTNVSGRQFPANAPIQRSWNAAPVASPVAKKSGLLNKWRSRWNNPKHAIPPQRIATISQMQQQVPSYY